MINLRTCCKQDVLHKLKDSVYSSYRLSSTLHVLQLFSEHDVYGGNRLIEGPDAGCDHAWRKTP
jgi:hypothetical protein